MTTTKNSSLIKSNDSTKCNRPMGLGNSFRGSIAKLRFCQRDAASCKYHKRTAAANG